MAWTGKIPAAAAARVRHSETDVPRVLEKLDAIMAVSLLYTLHTRDYIALKHPPIVAANGVH